MAFHETQLPTNISKNVSGGVGFNTTIIELQSGAEFRSTNWANAKRRWTVPYNRKSFDDLATLQSFAMNREGAMHGWRFKDWLDYCSTTNGRPSPTAITPNDQLLGIGDGTTTQFQLAKTYTSGPTTKIRRILKPVMGTVVAAVDGVTKTLGTDFTVDTTTGTLTFGTAPIAGKNVTAGFQFDVPARFGSNVDKLLQLQLQSVDTGAVNGSLDVVEELDPSVALEDVPTGGSQIIVTTASLQVTPLAGKLCLISASSTGFIVYVPSPSQFPDGGPAMVLHNNGSNAWALQTGSTVIDATVAAGEQRHLYIAKPSGVKTWAAFK